MEKLLFIASIQHGEPPTGGGAQAKNQLLLAHFRKYYDVKYFDTWKRTPAVSLLCAILYVILFNRKVVLSISGRGALGIGKLMQMLHIKRQVFYFVIGGDLGFFVEGHLGNVPVLKSFVKIFVQGHYMKEQLNKAGLQNVEVLPNFKPIGNLPVKKRDDSDVVKFVFLGRLIEEKGVGMVIDAARQLQGKYPGRFSVTFYGSPTEKYSQRYFTDMGKEYASYGGFLDLKSQDGLKELAGYDVMVFPTYFDGEGFPGVLIDAFKAGLPVIASDFHANPDVVRRPELGTLVKPRDTHALMEAMEKYIENPALLRDMAKAVQDEVGNYDMDVLLSKENLRKLLDSNK